MTAHNATSSNSENGPKKLRNVSRRALLCIVRAMLAYGVHVDQ